MISRQVRATEGRRLSHLPTSPLFLRGKVYPEREPEAEREEDDNMINQEPEEGNPGTEPEIGVEEDVEALSAATTSSDRPLVDDFAAAQDMEPVVQVRRHAPVQRNP